MRNLLRKIQENYIITMLSAIIIAAVIFLLTKYTSSEIIELTKNRITYNFYTKNAITKLLMIVFSIITMLILKKSDFRYFGFNMPGKINYFKFFTTITGIFIASFIIGLIIFIVILNHLFPMGEVKGFPEPASLIQMILTVWIWSSLSEEIMLRGLIQSIMNNMKHLKFLRLSIPVIISGLLFGAMHLGLLFGNMGFWFVIFISFNATVIGFVAAYYREKTDSLLIAFLVHLTANIVGYLPVLIKSFIS